MVDSVRSEILDQLEDSLCLIVTIIANLKILNLLSYSFQRILLDDILI